MPLDPGARSLLRNGLMQNDLDADFNKILNLDTSNLPINGPNDFPAQANKWLKSYSISTRNFTATQPLITEIGNFPSQAGQAGKFLKTDGSVLSFADPGITPGGAGSTYINVKDYGATGNGSTDDYAAINTAITANPGRTVYFPKGVYYVSQNLDYSALTTPIVLIGDGPAISILEGNAAIGSAILILPSNSFVQKLGFNGNILAASQPVPINRFGIGVVNAGNVVIRDCAVANCSSAGILAVACFGVLVQQCAVASCGGHGIQAANSPRTYVVNCQVSNCMHSGIYLVNSQQSIVKHNSVWSCGGSQEHGVFLWDSDNTVIEGNLIQQCGIGLHIITSLTRAQLATYGYSITGNNLIRNYYGGCLVTFAHGFRFSSNNVVENGQGGTDNATYTIEPGTVPDPGFVGSGYQVGDVLTLSGGTGTAAIVVVTEVDGAGGIKPNGAFCVSFGNYSAYPANPVSVTGGHGTGAKLIFTTARIGTAGLGYTNGQVLKSNTPTNNGNPVKVIITSVNSQGGVLTFGLLDGGGYIGSLPSSLSFVNESLGPGGEGFDGNDMNLGPSASGFTLVPSWGKRYSLPNQGQTTFGVAPYGPLVGALVGNNIIDYTRTGVGVLLLNDASGTLSGWAQLLIVTTNLMIYNLFGIKHKVVGGALDDDINHFQNNIIVSLPLNENPPANNIVFP